MNSEENLTEKTETEKINLDVNYASLGIRILAYLIDGVFIIPLELFIEYLIFRNINFEENSMWRNILNLSIWTIYYGITESSKYQGTIGKKICGIMVIDVEGNRLTFKKAYLRFLAQFISIIPLGFGIWSIATDKKKQAWHDMLLNCYVIKNQKEIKEINEIKEIKQIKY
ncbi:RDD family protein [Flavobacterium sp.]|jgi:uncharacterized RDD family membrane protein YckC|uniref:RDD family protein n=1 Tax=Flavobacterium sp. TaxID=239 RepID=UPI00391B322C